MGITRQSLEDEIKAEALEYTPVSAGINTFVMISDHGNFQMLSFGKLVVK